MKELISGGMVALYLVAGLFFLRFWARTRDTLFSFFAVAFWVLAAQRLALAFTDESQEHATWYYVVRFAAFTLILVGIWNKNRAKR